MKQTLKIFSFIVLPVLALLTGCGIICGIAAPAAGIAELVALASGSHNSWFDYSSVMDAFNLGQTETVALIIGAGVVALIIGIVSLILMRKYIKAMKKKPE